MSCTLLKIDGLTVMSVGKLHVERCIHRNVFPAIGLVHFPFLAALISAYSAGLMPFFLHFLISASVRPLMSKLLALHSPLDPDWLLSTSKDPESRGRSGCKDAFGLDKLDRCEVRSNETVRSIINRVGVRGGSSVL